MRVTLNTAKCIAGAIGAAALLIAPASFAASLSAIDSSAYATVIGAELDSLTSSYDFSADGIDGTITSTVYEGIGAASGYYVYTYSIQLSDSTLSSIDSVSFHFGSTPVQIAGIGDTFYVDDGSGNVAPTSASYFESSATAGFEYELNIGAGESSLEFGLFSAVAPAATDATLSGTTYGGSRGAIRAGGRGVYRLTSATASVLSNGVGAAPVPEPTAALVFAIGFATIAARCRSKAARV